MIASHIKHSAGYKSMQASDKHKNLKKPQQSYYQQNSMSLREVHSQLLPPNYQSLRNSYSGDCSQLKSTVPQTSHEQYCTLESFTSAGYTVHTSPSTLSYSPSTESPVSQQDCLSDNYGSPISVSCITEDPIDLKHKLRQLENVMLGPGSDIIDSFEGTFNSQLILEPEKWKQILEIPRGDLRQGLIACARALAENDMPVADWLMTELRPMVSVSGEPLQRLGAYLLEGLVARLASSGSSIYKALKCKEPASSELLSYMHILYEVCPFFKFGYMSANGAIAEAVKGEERVHIIDFQIAMGSQWVTLIQALAARPGGPPCLRITGVDDPVSAYARGGGLHLVGKRLSRLAESCNVPFEFNAAAISGCEVELNNLEIRSGEALAVNFPFQLHHMPDESVSTENHRDRLLRLVKSLSPKVVTLVEQESNTNTAPFFPRFVETLDYYTAIFESIDVALPRENNERSCVCAERVERHELLGKWKSRFTMAGFTPYPLSPLVNATSCKLLLEVSTVRNYRLVRRRPLPAILVARTEPEECLVLAMEMLCPH
ncbi:scarecrow-like protein 21 [Dioscorea cayenensis subsp. rotundata]|uniref:Scarecrow-like protein 21 n=1 Tax=Dioscorea cayennensis subsp. rotundata TaxID=55577 RepID=A0AB40CAG6_DIOCR|nr:scarecrow-like protein 21 [Dioscorea cayenensis subsp. rotundata]